MEFCLNIVLAVPLIYYYGFVGAAIAFLVTKIVETFLRNYLLQSLWGIKRMEIQSSLWKPLLLTGGIFVVVLLVNRIPIGSPALLVLTVALYALYLFSFKGFRQKIALLVNRSKGSHGAEH